MILRRYHDVTVFLILIISAVVVLRSLLNIAIFKSLNLSFFILIFCILILILFLIVFFVFISHASSIATISTIVHLLIVVVLNVVAFIVVLLIFKLVFIVLLVVVLALSALSIASFACAHRSIGAQFFVGSVDLAVQIDRELLPVRVVERPVSADLCNKILDLLLIKLLSSVLLQLLLDLLEVFVRYLKPAGELNVPWFLLLLLLLGLDLLLRDLMLCIERLLQILEILIHLVHYNGRTLCQKKSYMRRIAMGRIGAKTLLLSDKGPRLPVVSAIAADFPLINFLYNS